MRAALLRAWSWSRFILLIVGAVFAAPFILVLILSGASDTRR
jgi:hypothetical protein